VNVCRSSARSRGPVSSVGTKLPMEHFNPARARAFLCHHGLGRTVDEETVYIAVIEDSNGFP
jgi:hypothetical protein